MKSVKKDILGFEVEIPNIPETLAELVAAAGSEQAVLDGALAYTLYHSHFTKLRTAIVEKLEKLTGIARETEEVNGKTKVVEKDGSYIARLEEELGAETLQGYLAEVQEVSTNLPVSYTPTVRGVGTGGKPAQKWLAMVDDLISADKLEAFASKFDIDLTQDESDWRTDVAQKLKEVVTNAQRAAAAAALAV